MERSVIESLIGYLIHATKTSFNYTEMETTKIKLVDKELVIRVKCHDKPETSVIFNSIEITNDETMFSSMTNTAETFKNENLEYIW